MTTLTPPPPAATVHCTRCGRRLTNAVSRVLGVGDRCRHGLTERELIASLTEGATT